MDACLLYVLHDSTDNSLFSVGDSVHVDLNSVLKEFVDEYGVVGGGKQGPSGKFLQRCPIIDNHHGSPAKDIRGPHHHGVANNLRYFCSLHYARGRTIVGLCQAQLLEEGLEKLSIFCQGYAFWWSAEYWYPDLSQGRGEIEGGLSSKLQNKPHGPFGLNNV